MLYDTSLPLTRIVLGKQVGDLFLRHGACLPLLKRLAMIYAP